jgi:mono/diheme cytochrome c family protein
MNKYFAAVGIAIVITGFTIIQSNQSMHQGDPDNGLAGSDWVLGDKEKLIKVILFGLEGEIKVNGQAWNGLMPAHEGFLSDHAVASILTYIRQNFGNKAIEVIGAEVANVRKSGK